MHFVIFNVWDFAWIYIWYLNLQLNRNINAPPIAHFRFSNVSSCSKESCIPRAIPLPTATILIHCPWQACQLIWHITHIVHATDEESPLLQQKKLPSVSVAAVIRTISLLAGLKPQWRIRYFDLCIVPLQAPSTRIFAPSPCLSSFPTTWCSCRTH